MVALRMLWFISLTAVGVGCGQPDWRNFPPTRGHAWIAFGDSLTAGTGASDGQTYPSLLGQRLGVSILNAGIPGLTTAGGLERVDEVIALEPSVVLLCLGGNDGLQQMPLNETIANLSAIIARLQDAGTFVVLIGVRSASLLDRYDKPLRQLAKEKQTLFIPDILDDVLGKRSLMADQIHPNDAGYALIATRLEKELRRAGVVPPEAERYSKDDEPNGSR